MMEYERVLIDDIVFYSKFKGKIERATYEDWSDYYRITVGEVDPRDLVKRYIGPYLKDMQLTKEDDDFTIMIRHGLDGRFLHIMYVCTIKLDHIPIEVFEQIDDFLKEYGNMKEVTSIPRQPEEGIYYISMMLPCSLIAMRESVFLNSSE